MAASTAAGSADGASASLSGLSMSEQTFLNHKVSVGEWVAVYFDQGLFFGVVVEIKVLNKSGGILVDADGPIDLQHPSATPQYILGGTDSYLCTYLLQYAYVYAY